MIIALKQGAATPVAENGAIAAPYQTANRLLHPADTAADVAGVRVGCWEREVLRELSLQNGLVIATGGGAPLCPENVKNLRRNGTLVFLDRPIARLGVGRGRPLAQTPEQMAALARERLPVYRAAADAALENSGDADAAVERLCGLVAPRM